MKSVTDIFCEVTRSHSAIPWAIETTAKLSAAAELGMLDNSRAPARTTSIMKSERMCKNPKTSSVNYRFKFFRSYGKVPPLLQLWIQIRLGKPGGRMRARASRECPPCTIATLYDVPVGWACAFRGRPNSLHPRRRTIQVYVHPEHRRRRVGNRLMELLMSEARLENRTVSFHPDSRGARKFFDHALR